MNFKQTVILTGFFILITGACNTSNVEEDKLKIFYNYFEAMKSKSEEKWNYTTDTIKVWFDDVNNTPRLNIKGVKSNGPWKGWDEVMNSSISYDSVWFDAGENAIKGYFYENNDFYELIGKRPTKTLRTYWLNEEGRINGILMYWIPEENITSDEYLKPIVDWALKHDSVEINELYPNRTIIPSRENALRWKALLEKYNSRQ